MRLRLRGLPRPRMNLFSHDSRPDTAAAAVVVVADVVAYVYTLSNAAPQ